MDQKLADEYDPLDLMKCQLGDANVVSGGQRLTLNQQGLGVPMTELRLNLQGSSFDFRSWLSCDVPEKKERPGFWLEYATAAALLKLGLPMVRRSVKTQSAALRQSRLLEGELDLLFNWAGKRWVVDCKDRSAPEDRAHRLEAAIRRAGGALTDELRNLLENYRLEFKEKEIAPLKLDLLDAADAGGLLGRSVAVRTKPLPDEAMALANSRKVPLLYKENLVEGLESLLYPDRKASPGQLASLRQNFSKSGVAGSRR